MLRFACAICHSILQVPLDLAGRKAKCPWCDHVMYVPSNAVSVAASQVELLLDHGKSETGISRRVEYLHHTRDADGDILFYFIDPADGEGRPASKSSPVQGLRRLHGAIIEGRGNGRLARYQITTRNTKYEVQMAADKADHLAKELGIALAELAPEKQRARLSE